MIPSRWHLPLLVALAALLFLLRLGALDIMPPDEPRYAQVSQEMLHSGNFVTPTLNGETYKEKPPMLFWCSALLGEAIGDVDPWAARLPSAFGAIAAVLFTYLLARRMFGADIAFLSALILMTIGRFWWQARVGQIDMLLTAFVTGAIFALWRWHQERRTVDLVLLYTMLALGMLTKGPPALVFPFLIIITFYWGRKEDRRGLRGPLGLLFVALVFCLWLIPARMAVSGQSAAGGSEQHAFGEVLKQTVGRFLLGVSKAEWPWYYLVNLPKDLVPWTLLLPIALPVVWRARKENDAMRFLWAWVLPAFIFFTISIAKRVTYILPLYPAIAILIAVGLRSAIAELRAAWRHRLTLLWAALLWGIAFGPWCFIRVPMPGYAILDGLSVLLLFAGYYEVRISVDKKNALVRAWERNGVLGEVLAWVRCVELALIVSVIAIVLPAVLNDKYSVSEFCAPVAAATARGEDFDVYSLALFREELLYYGRHKQIEVLMDPLEVEDGTSLSSLKAQVDLLAKLRKDVKALTLADTSKASADDQSTLDAWLKGFIDGAKHKDETAKLLDALKAELDRFQTAFTGDRKALCFVEERDWRWLRAVEPKLAHWHVVSQRKLPDRTLLLIANASGEGLLK